MKTKTDVQAGAQSHGCNQEFKTTFEQPGSSQVDISQPPQEHLTVQPSPDNITNGAK